MIREAVKYENNYWHQQNLPSTGCFGYVNHHLILGTGHHQAIMMALINNGWSWEQLMAAPQAWGWYEVNSDHYYSKIKTVPPDLKQGEYPYYINIWFSSDAGYQNKDETKRAMGAFAQLYHLPCFDNNEGVVKAVNPDKEYGSGLHGKEYSENWTDEKLKNIQELQNKWLFQVPEDMPKPDVPTSESTPLEPIEEQKSESIPSPNNHWKIGDNFSFNTNLAGTYEVLAVDGDQVTFTGAPDTKYKTDIGKQWTYHLDNLSDTTINKSKTDPVKESGVWLVHYKAPQGYEGKPPFDKALGKMTVTAPDGPGASQVVIDYFQKNFGVPVDITGSDPYWPGQTSVKNSSIIKESEQSYPRGWSGIMEKAQAIRQAGGVRILRNDPDHVVGTVQSGSDPANKGPYNTEIWRDDPNSQAITMWNCDCPWSDYSWGRTRQWKKYEGRPCAHTLALFWDAQSNPPQGTTTVPESQPPTPAPGGQMMMNQGLIQPLGQPPMPNVPLTGEPGMPAPISPTPQQQPAISQPTVPGKEQGTISFPGALSKVAADDFFRGTNRDSEVLEAFVYYNGQIAFAKGFHTFAWAQLNIPHDYDESKLAAGSIELIYTQPYTEESDPEGYVVVDFESQDVTYDPIPLPLQLAVLKKVRQYYPTATIFQGKYASWKESMWPFRKQKEIISLPYENSYDPSRGMRWAYHPNHGLSVWDAQAGEHIDWANAHGIKKADSYAGGLINPNGSKIYEYHAKDPNLGTQGINVVRQWIGPEYNPEIFGKESAWKETSGLEMDQAEQYKYGWKPNGLQVWKVDPTTGDPHHFEVLGTGHEKYPSGRLYAYPNQLVHHVWINRGTEYQRAKAAQAVQTWAMQNFGKPITKTNEVWDEALNYKQSSFNNGDIVRTWETVQGMVQQAYGQPGYPITIGKNKSGEVLYSDDQTTVVIFPLKTGPLGHHLVKVECPTQNLYLDNTNAQPFVKKHT